MEYFAYSQREFVYKYVVMFSDLDLFKHMSYANYLRLMFLSSDALLIPFFKDTFANEVRLKVMATTMQFKHQTTIGEQVLIKINSSKIDSCSFSLLYTFVAETTGNLISLGKQEFCLERLLNHEKVTLPGCLISAVQPIAVNEEHLLYKY